jgi:hypothetical protein
MSICGYESRNCYPGTAELVHRIEIAYFSVMDSLKTNCQAFVAFTLNSFWPNHFGDIYVPLVDDTGRT